MQIQVRLDQAAAVDQVVAVVCHITAQQEHTHKEIPVVQMTVVLHLAQAVAAVRVL